MLFSHTWLQKYFNKKLPKPEELADILSLHAFEVEGVDGDNIDIDVLPNRAHDALSYVGMAGEIGVLLKLDTKDPLGDFELKTTSKVRTADRLTLRIEDAALVPRAMKRLVMNVNVGESPEWIKNELASVGQRSINNIVDATNYIMLATGQPVHAFDFDKVTGAVTIRHARSGEKITLLDDSNHELDETMLVIADEKHALDIAGIKGGTVSGIDTTTKNVMLSVCNFDLTSIRKTSQKLKLRTDASIRFENGITPERTEYAMKSLSALVQNIAGGDVTEDMLDEYPNPVSRWTIKLDIDHVRGLLGVDISVADVISILERLGCKVEPFDAAQGDGLRVTPPVERLDLTIQEDLIEEVGRIYGYGNIDAVIPRGTAHPPERNELVHYSNIARDILTATGFTEVYTYSMTDHGEIEVQNPVSKDRSFLRTSLIPAMQYAVNENLKYTKEVRIFELAHVFPMAGDEYTSLAMVSSVSDGFYEMKGVVETIAETLGIHDLFYVDSKRSNTLAEIHIDNMEIGTISNNTCELNFDLLVKAVNDEVEFRPISRYPSVSRDLSLFVPLETKVVEVLDVIENTAGGLLVDTDLFDTFQKDDRKSLAFRLVFQSHDKTLTDKEVNSVMESVYQALRATSDDWEVR